MEKKDFYSIEEVAEYLNKLADKYEDFEDFDYEEALENITLKGVEPTIVKREYYDDETVAVFHTNPIRTIRLTDGEFVAHEVDRDAVVEAAEEYAEYINDNYEIMSFEDFLGNYPSVYWDYYILKTL